MLNIIRALLLFLYISSLSHEVKSLLEFGANPNIAEPQHQVNHGPVTG